MSRTKKLQKLLTTQFNALASNKGSEYKRVKRINNGEIRRIPSGAGVNLAKHKQPDANKREPVVERSVSKTYRTDVRHNQRSTHNGKYSKHTNAKA